MHIAVQLICVCVTRQTNSNILDDSDRLLLVAMLLPVDNVARAVANALPKKKNNNKEVQERRRRGRGECICVCGWRIQTLSVVLT